MHKFDHIELDWIKRWALYSPDNIALQSVEEDRKLTYSELNALINKAAGYLTSELEVSAGDRVAILSMNRLDYVILFFAIQRLGAIMLPLNYRLAAPEIDFQLENSGAQILIYEEDFGETVSKLRTAVNTFDFTAVMEGVHQKTEQNYTHVGEFETPCMILYTSGTTGRPKGALITNKMLFWNSINTGLRLNLTQNEVILTFAPFFHTGGWNVLTTPVLHRGGKVILLKKFDPAQILSLSEVEKASILFGVPTMMAMMAEDPSFETTDLSTIRYAIVGGEPMPIPLIETWQNKGIPIRQGYGLTEFGPNVFSLNEEDAIRKKGSIGFPNFYIDAAIFDDNGNQLGANQIGELWLKGPVCMAGYWNNEEATSKTIENGWLKTGDMVKRDEEGYYYIVDRKKDMFISGAENVYPAEIEHVIRSHDDVKDVAVVGVPDEKWGEVGKAFVVSRSGESSEEDLRAFCKENLAKFKVPKYIKFLDELPKSDTGKILKRTLKEL